MPDRSKIAQALAGSPAAFDSQGLQQPAIDPIMLFSSAAGPAIARALTGVAASAPRMMASQAGAIFPEDTQFNLGDLSKKDFYTPAEQQYALWENTAKQYLANNDFAGALRAKWGMLKNAGGNI